MEVHKLYTDGSYQPDVAIAGIGGYLLDPQGQCLFEFSEPLAQPSFFKFHESLALIHGLKKCLELGVSHLACFSDDVSFRKILNDEILSDTSGKTNPFRKEIFELKSKFKFISFNHLPRQFNKRADKLAGKPLRIYNEETTPNRTRDDFIGQEDKWLYIPQLLCDEDFEKSPGDITHLSQSLEHFFLIHVAKNGLTRNNVDDDNPLTIRAYFIEVNGVEIKQVLVKEENLIQKKLTTRGLEILHDIFHHYPSYSSQPHERIGLMFHAVEQPLQKIDMLLRRRGILPLPDTPLTRKLLHSSKQFSQIVLHNRSDLIETVLLEQRPKHKARI